MSANSATMPAGGSSTGLFTNQIIKFVMLGLGCVFSVVIGVQISSADTNGLATFMRYVAAGTFIFAMVSPRGGIYLVLFMCPVLDLVKRLLILFDTLSMIDVASVLAVAPVTLAGAMTGTLFNRFIFRRKAAVPGESVLYLMLATITLLSAVAGVMHNVDSKLMLLRNLGENCIYVCLIVLVPVYFPTTEDIAALLRWCVAIFVPVALYGFWQEIFGLSDFEWRYLLSGLTVMADDFMGSERVFSTLNSNHSFSVTMACCLVICQLQRHLPATVQWQKFMQKRATWFFLIFFAATAVSLRRTGGLVVLFSLVGAFCFRSRFRTLAFYGFLFLATVFVILNSEFIFVNLPGWETTLQRTLPGHDQALQLQTFNDRLASFQNLRDNPAIWTPFGMPPDERGSVYTHDAISETLVSYGVVGLLAFVVVFCGVMTVSHRLVWKATKATDQSYVTLLLAFIFANLFVGALMQSHINIFPINVIFWICAGALLKVTTYQQPIVDVEPEEEPEEPESIIRARHLVRITGKYSQLRP